MKNIIPFAVLLFVASTSCGQKSKPDSVPTVNTKQINMEGLQLATFGSGCFWCTEAVFQQIDGVEKVESGRVGSKTSQRIKKVQRLTDAESIQLTTIQKSELDDFLERFLQNMIYSYKQGADEGTQYRSVVFYHTPEQNKLAEGYKKKLDEEKVYRQPIVTEISAAPTFYKAENYHQNYYNLNGNAPYCSYVIQPKLDKFKKVFKDKLKNNL